MSQELFNQLDGLVGAEWARIKDGRFARHVFENGVDRPLYKITMLQLYHYTRYNSINQAFAAWNVEPERIGMLRFCYEHANEELGHEKMVVHDLKSIGLLEPGDLARPPLPSTEALIGYLHYVALVYGAVPRLGYSYWAESVYGHIDELLGRARLDLSLSDAQMSFFVAHSTIDEKHAEEVRHAIAKHSREGLERERMLQVAQTTLRLTGNLLDEALDARLALGGRDQ